MEAWFKRCRRCNIFNDDDVDGVCEYADGVLVCLILLVVADTVADVNDDGLSSSWPPSSLFLFVLLLFLLFILIGLDDRLGGQGNDKL